jgi:hypothetical protein
MLRNRSEKYQNMSSGEVNAKRTNPPEYLYDRIWHNKYIRLGITLKTYETAVRPVVTHSPETRGHSEDDSGTNKIETLYVISGLRRH